MLAEAAFVPSLAFIQSAVREFGFSSTPPPYQMYVKVIDCILFTHVLIYFNVATLKSIFRFFHCLKVPWSLHI